MQIDTSTDFGRRVERRLKEERIAWLTTVRADGAPEPSPVWFLWNGQDFLVFSRPDTPKLRNVARNPKVSLNLDGDGRGGDIIVVTGEARLEPGMPPQTELDAYGAKYAEGFTRIGMSAEQFYGAYSAQLRIAPRKLRGH